MNLISLMPEIDKEYSTVLDCCSWTVASYCEIKHGFQVTVETDEQKVLLHFEDKESELPFQIFVCKSDGSVDDYIVGAEYLHHYYFERGFSANYEKKIRRAVEHTQMECEGRCKCN